MSEQKAKMVKIKALQSLKLVQKDTKTKITAKTGDILEVEESVAKELCKPIKLHYSFSGERSGEDGKARHIRKRAELVTA